jgi:proline iminopeptidase
VSTLYPEIAPYASGLLDVGDGNLVYLPHAADPPTDLSANTTQHLVADVERLREELGVERWLVLGGSWGSTLALAYAVAHPERVGEAVLFGVTTGRHEEFDWIFRGGVSPLFPVQRERLQATGGDGADVLEAFEARLNDPDPAARQHAAEEWCRWESATVDGPPTDELDGVFVDPRYALALARIVVRYARRYGWLEDGALLHGAGALGAIPAVLGNGRLDFQAPIGWAWKLAQAWPGAELVVVRDAGHSFAGGLGRELVRAIDRFRS